MKVYIIGVGGVGGYFGGKIANAGYDTTFLARGKTYNALLTNGLKINSINGNVYISEPKIINKISKVKDPDLIILGIKSWQVKGIAKDLSDVVGKDTKILPLQNGVLASQELQEFIPQKNILGGLCRIISKIESPGVINHFGVDPIIVFGELDNKLSAEINNVKKLFDLSGINSVIAEDITAEIWKKFIAICVSGFMAVSRSTIGPLRTNKLTRDLIRGLLNEIFELSRYYGVNIESSYVDKTMEFIDQLSENASYSLARDVWEGRPSEIEYQNGSVYKLALQKGVSVPINETIYKSILPMEIEARRSK
jgi:2-dehydropantoate 2-reductase